MHLAGFIPYTAKGYLLCIGCSTSEMACLLIQLIQLPRSTLQARATKPMAREPNVAREKIFLARGTHSCHNIFPTNLAIL
jgi:hypothetical protein